MVRSKNNHDRARSARPRPVLEVTEEQATALRALWLGRFSVETFATDVLGLDVNYAQRRWWQYINPAEDGWTWRFKRVAHVAANQIGKSLGLAVIILWACWYKIGVDPSDRDFWQSRSYNWFHVAPSQAQAYIPLDDALRLARGEHEAQKRPSRLPKGLVEEGKADVYYRCLNFFNGSVAQFRTTEEKAKALQGKRAAGISMDECAFEDHLTSVINEVLMMRLVSTGGPFFPVSTPNGINDWFEYVQEIIDNAKPRTVPDDGDPMLGGWAKPGEPLPCWEHALEPAALVWSAIEDNVGFGIPEAEWQRMERTLDAATKEQQLRGAFLEPAEAFFVPIKAVEEAFDPNLPLQQGPKAGHSYVIGWDPAAKKDATVVVVVDVTTEPWTGVYFERWEHSISTPQLILKMYEVHALYNGGGMTFKPGESPPRARTVFDETGFGGAIYQQLLRDLHPKRGINLGGPNVKLDLLGNLRAALTSGKLRLPRWTRMMREVLTYKLPDDKIVQDCVMALVLPVERAPHAAGVTRTAFRPRGR